MAKRALKVFRTSTGFEDAYVATPSRKAALDAWGTDKDLFARGAAEQVTDPQVIALALRNPGEVVRLPRATLAEHLYAAKPVPTTDAEQKNRKDKPRAQPEKRAPKPSRAKVEAARSQLEAREHKLSEALKAIDTQMEQLREQRAVLRREGEADVDRLRSALEGEEERYRAALAGWEG